MRACEGCRKRKIKCDAATTNTWPCSACTRLKLHCVKPNSYDGIDSATTYDAAPDSSTQLHQISLSGQIGPDVSKTVADIYQTSYDPADPSAFQPVTFDASQGSHPIHYTTMPFQGGLDHPYNGSNAFPAPPVQQVTRQESSPGAQSADSFQQQDLADLLGGLKVNELGTGRSCPRLERCGSQSANVAVHSAILAQ